MTTPHEDLGYVHPVHDSRLVYTSYANLLVGAGVTADMVGKLALLTTDNSLWRCEQYTPNIKWRQVSGAKETRGAQTIIVDHVNGNDTTGDGSVSYPYKSFRFLNDFSGVLLKHDITIKPKASLLYDYWPQDYCHNPASDGRLIIDASGETYPVQSGPYTVDTATGIGPPGPSATSLATLISVSGTPWSSDAYRGQFIHMLTGSAAGYVLPIRRNDANSIETHSNWYSIGSGDTFNIVDCPVKIATGGGVFIHGNCDGVIESTSSSANVESPYEMSFLVCGVRFDTNTTRQNDNPFRLEKVSATFSFCGLWNMDSNAIGGFDKKTLISNDGQLNSRPLAADTFDNAKLTDWYWFPLTINHVNVNQADEPSLQISNSVCSLIVTRGSVSAGVTGRYGQGCALLYSLCGSILDINPGSTVLASIYIQQQDGPEVGIGIQGGLCYIQGIYIANTADEAIQISSGAVVKVTWLKGDNIGADYAVSIVDCSRMIIESAADVVISGAVGAVDFLFSGTQHVNFPTTGNVIEDIDHSIVATR